MALADSRSSVSLIVRPLLEGRPSPGSAATASRRSTGGLEDVAVGPKVTEVPVSSVARVGERCGRHARLVVLRPAVAVGLDLDGDLRGQGVHDGDTDAVQTGRTRQPPPPNLPPRAARSGRPRRPASPRRDDADGDAAAVVDDADAAVGKDRDVDRVRVTGQRLVDRLSTTSCTMWCRPRSPVEPMYMPGRFRGPRPALRGR